MIQKCHYKVLGVSKDASIEDIKKAFRKLSFETHPDVVGKNGACPERFKAIANAASVLTNPKSRRQYDYQVSQNLFRRTPEYAEQNAAKARKNHQAAPELKGFARTLENLFRPRNLVLGPLALYVTVTTLQWAFGYDRKQPVYDDSDMLVQAWMNPQTGRYETPAPWDPIFRLNPTLEQVPRNQVTSRHR